MYCYLSPNLTDQSRVISFCRVPADADRVELREGPEEHLELG